MINAIKLTNFKCYTQQTFELATLTVFCGSNSVGKSTAIQALAIPFQNHFNNFALLNGELVQLGKAEDIFSHYANPNDDHLEIILEFEDHEYLWGLNNINEQNHINNDSMKAIEKKRLAKHYFLTCGFQFLSAERLGPRNYLENNNDNSIRMWLGSQGEYIYQILKEVDELSEKLKKNDPRIINPKEGLTTRRNILNWMAEISPGFFFAAESVKSADISHAIFRSYDSKDVKPTHMGFGLSYSISIVTALLITKPGGLVVIENPEAHLHPRGQSYLGRLIARAALAGVQVILETHSDHLLNGIRVTARLNNEYKKGLFKVFYVAATAKAQSSVTEIEIGEKGELTEWPIGFFDQQAFDVKTLMTGQEVTQLGVNNR